MKGQKWLVQTDRSITEYGLDIVRSCLVPERAVAISCIGSDMGKAVILTRPSVTNQQINTIEVDETRFNAEFIYYDLSIRQQELKSAAGGSATPILNKGHFSKFQISIPPKEIQDKIVAILGSLDNKIDLNFGISQTLDATAQVIFKSWFVDFDPVKAKIAAKENGRDPIRAAMTVLSGKTEAELDAQSTEQFDALAATAALFPEEMIDTELGKIPKGWSFGLLGDICNFTAGSAFNPEHQGAKEGDFPFIKVSDMNLPGNKIFIQSANNYVNKAQQMEMKAKIHPSGATVFAKIGVALISNRRRLLTAETIIDNNLMSAISLEGKSSQYFLYSMFRTLDFNILVSGTALPYLNVSDLKKIPIVLPTNAVRVAFESKASAIFSLMQSLATQSTVLASLRDNLLPKLITGEVDAYGLPGGE